MPIPHSTAPFSLGGHPRGVAGMGPGLTRYGGGVGDTTGGGYNQGGGRGYHKGVDTTGGGGGAGDTTGGGGILQG